MIQQSDLTRMAEILKAKHTTGGKEFKTDEIRFSKGRISLWDMKRVDWVYLKTDLTWTRDIEADDLFTFE